MDNYKRGGTRIQGCLRVITYNDQINITDCTNASKRGKTCDMLQLYSKTNHHDWFVNVIYNQSLKLCDVTTFEQALAWANCCTDSTVNTYTKKGADVTPVNCEPVILQTDNIYLHIEYVGFICRDLTDRYNDPTWIESHRDSKTLVRKFYFWCQKNKDRFTNLTLHELSSLAQKEVGIWGHYYCAVD
jgi:hypothetical protein